MLERMLCVGVLYLSLFDSVVCTVGYVACCACACCALYAICFCLLNSFSWLCVILRCDCHLCCLIVHVMLI